MTARRWPAAVPAVLAAAAAVQGVQALWIPAKAELSQVLLRWAWHRTEAGAERCRPWPWADSWPVARLSFPEHAVELIVLAGASGATLAFAPGHLDGSEPPGGDGVSVIAGHRDTHFAVLERLVPGERVLVETPDGRVREYVVQSGAVVHESDTEALGRAGPLSLVLVTCWPFDGVSAGGDQRYLVWATAVGSRSQHSTASPLADVGDIDVACSSELRTTDPIRYPRARCPAQTISTPSRRQCSTPAGSGSSWSWRASSWEPWRCSTSWASAGSSSSPRSRPRVARA